ncbi:MAG TPA: FecR domain-containing protein [Puia sp.]|nr:FecR domain-containing protein [Puia sp.]
MSRNQLAALFRKYLDDNISPEEFSQLYELINSRDYSPEALDDLLQQTFSNAAPADGITDYNRHEILDSLMARIAVKEETAMPVRKVIPIHRRRWVAAAAIAILLAGGFYLVHRKQPAPASLIAGEKRWQQFDLPPGKSGAILTLSNGKQILLDSVRNGNLENQGSARLVKGTDMISYEAEQHSREQVVYNSMSTPRGRQYQMILADGSRVWLNAASSIRFPTSFPGNERRVEVTGEAYFEIAPDKQKPFIVQTGQTEVQVLGTHFDLMAYDDENHISATLIEGAVKVKSGSQEQVLSPGQQGSIEKSTGNLSVMDVETDPVIAWTQERLALTNADFGGLMRQISRWYDVDIVFDGKVPDLQIGGFIHKDVYLSTVMEFLGRNGLHYRMEGRKIIIRQ